MEAFSILWAVKFVVQFWLPWNILRIKTWDTPTRTLILIALHLHLTQQHLDSPVHSPHKHRQIEGVPPTHPPTCLPVSEVSYGKDPSALGCWGKQPCSQSSHVPRKGPTILCICTDDCGCFRFLGEGLT